MAAPIMSEKMHRFDPKRESALLGHTLNFCPQCRHTQRCSVCVSPAPCIPIAAPPAIPVVAAVCAHPIPVNTVVGNVKHKEGVQHIAANKFPYMAGRAPSRPPRPQQLEPIADEPQHIFFPFTPFAVTSATTCRSCEPHFGQVMPPAEILFSGNSATAFIGVRQYWQKFESFGIVFPQFLQFISTPLSSI